MSDLMNLPSGEHLQQKASFDEVLELAKMLFEHIESQINRADTKAQLTLAADALLMSALTLSGKGASFKSLIAMVSIVEKLVAFLGLLMFISLIISMYFALSVVARPTLRIPRQHRRVLFFFRHIAELTEDKFIEQFSNQTLDEIRESILSEVYGKALVANRKFVGVRNSINFLILALVLWVAMQALGVFIP